MQNLKKIIDLVSKKCNLDKTREDKDLMNPHWLLDAIVQEAKEVKEEIRPNNRAYLEDELGDILWGWLALVEKLKRDGFVGGHEDIFRRTLKKYEERIEPLDGTMRDYERWKEVKAKQKEALEEERCKNTTS
ncbi:MazG-related protein [hydrothermal vent metagenome]|uniref:MazG-related protein n=1 Tax=hydrothermal vent metagenome TaxID=652676 RepID=A0A1W1C8V1_9ZZZZ